MIRVTRHYFDVCGMHTKLHVTCVRRYMGKSWRHCARAELPALCKLRTWWPIRSCRIRILLRLYVAVCWNKVVWENILWDFNTCIGYGGFYFKFMGIYIELKTIVQRPTYIVRNEKKKLNSTVGILQEKEYKIFRTRANNTFALIW